MSQTLTSAMSRWLPRIEPRYAHVLVDEAQDFGTTELGVLRALAHFGPNDLFLAGDVAQTILPKHRSLQEAGVRIDSWERIRQNYRNSREILRAAHDLLLENLHEELFEGEGLEVLDPRFANFSGPIPAALTADDLLEEIAYARTYAATRLRQEVRTVCVALAGFSARDVSAYAQRLGLRALDGAYDPSSEPLVISDLEQTKGYEFDTLIILNCCEGVLPAREAPTEEAFRDACKLYVAMTRARRELILSFHGAASPWLKAVGASLATDRWDAYEVLDEALLVDPPARLPEQERAEEGEWTLSGPQFLYTAKALELSPEAQDKVAELVDGVGLRSSRGTRLKWRTVGGLMRDLHANRSFDRLLGPKVAEEIRSKLAG